MPFAAVHLASATSNGAQALIDALVAAGVEVIFGYPGGAVLPVYDALYAPTVACGTRCAARAGGGAPCNTVLR
jgi:hypothetical protein